MLARYIIFDFMREVELFTFTFEATFVPLPIHMKHNVNTRLIKRLTKITKGIRVSGADMCSECGSESQHIPCSTLRHRGPPHGDREESLRIWVHSSPLF